VVQVIKSLQDPLEVGNNLPGINDNVRERGLEHKSVRLHPTGYGTGAGNELGGKCIDVRGRARTIDLSLVTDIFC